MEKPGAFDNKQIKIPLIFYNTFLMPGFNLEIGPFQWAIGKSPDLAARAVEIGRAFYTLEKRYGGFIVGLCEVWREKEQSALVAAWPDVQRPFIVQGADAGNLFDLQNLGAGIMTLTSQNFQVCQTKRHTFFERGSRWKDADYYANKGVLLTEVDVGISNCNLEIYVTHLFNGGVFKAPSNAQRLPIQLKQLDELVQFIIETHQERNVIILAGDFNIHATDSVGYPEMMRRLAQVGLVDLWGDHHDTPGYTSSFDKVPEICVPTSGRDAIESTKTSCVERKLTSEERWVIQEKGGSGRIDYIFVSKQVMEGETSVSFSPPHRKPFLREPNPTKKHHLHAMSDHLAIECLISLKRKNL